MNNVTKSEAIGNLAKALSAFQAEAQDVLKENTNEFFRSKYADLPSVLESIRPISSKHQLAILQFPCSPNGTDTIGLETIVMHSSGEWISGFITCPLQAEKGKSFAQTIGSVITYLRRTALCSVMGIAQTDNDGNMDIDERRALPKKGPNNSSVKAKVFTQNFNTETPQGLQGIEEIAKISDSSIDDLNFLIETNGVTLGQQQKWLAHFNVKTLSELTEANAKKLIKNIRKHYSMNALEEEARHGWG